MWQVDGRKETCGTQGGLVSRPKTKRSVVTTNDKKSAEVIVLGNREGPNYRR